MGNHKKAADKAVGSMLRKEDIPEYKGCIANMMRSFEVD